MNEELKEALYRRALGFESDEVVEEYSFCEGEAVLLKRKVTKKHVPPDISAAKMLLDGEKPVKEMSDAELEREKERLLLLLKSKEGKN